MFRTALTAALVSSLALVSLPALAGDGGGNDDGFMTVTKPDRSSVTGVFHRDRSRTDIHSDGDGRVTGIGHKPAPRAKPARVKKPKPARAPKPKSRPYASAYDPDTGVRTTAIGNGNGTRTVITFGPFGIGIGISR